MSWSETLNSLQFQSLIKLNIVQAPEAVFTTLYFLRKLRIGTISNSFIIHPAGKACQGRTLVDWTTCKLLWNSFFVNTALGNCGKFYFPFKFEYQMWVQIYQKLKIDRNLIYHLSNWSNRNTDKPTDIWNRPNLNEYRLISEKLRLNYLFILKCICNVSVSTIFYYIYLQTYCLNVTQQVHDLQNLAMRMIN